MAEEQQEQNTQQKVTVEDIGPARKCLTIEVPADRIAHSLTESFNRLKGDTQIPGFRKGRAPLRLIERRFGTSVRDDVCGDIISKSYSKAVDDEKLDVIGEPDVKDLKIIELPDEGPMTFQVEVEVSPIVELPPLEGIPAQRTPIEISDGDVEDEINRWRERFGRVESSPGPTQEGDRLQCEVHVYAGESAGDENQLVMHLPEASVLVTGESLEYRGHVVGLLVENLGRRLADRSPGDETEWTQTGPPNHEDERIRSSTITIKLRIDGISRLKTDSLETLCGHMGYEDVAMLRQQIMKLLESRREFEQKSDMHRQLSDYLLAKVELELPEALTSRQTARMMMRHQAYMQHQGVAESETEQRLAEIRASSEAEIRNQLKLFFVISQAAKTLNIEVTDDEVNTHISAIARQQGRRPEKLRQDMRRQGQLENTFLQIREFKTLDKILESAKITDREPALLDTAKPSDTEPKPEASAREADDEKQ